MPTDQSALTEWIPARLAIVNREYDIIMPGPRVLYEEYFSIGTRQHWFTPKKKYTWTPCHAPAFPVRLALISPPGEIIFATVGLVGYRIKRIAWTKNDVAVTIRTRTGLPVTVWYQPNEFIPLTPKGEANVERLRQS